MLREIDINMQLTVTEIEKVESCFWIATAYWEKLKELIKDISLLPENEEIEFFRNVKPQFTSYIEYFIILSEAVRFVPESTAEKIDYWQIEMKRYERFVIRNHDFIQYYESDNLNPDRYSFKKIGDANRFRMSVTFYDSDPEFCSLHDHLARGYLAQKRYWEYAKKKKDEAQQ